MNSAHSGPASSAEEVKALAMPSSRYTSDPGSAIVHNAGRPHLHARPPRHCIPPYPCVPPRRHMLLSSGLHFSGDASAGRGTSQDPELLFEDRRLWDIPRVVEITPWVADLGVSPLRAAALLAASARLTSSTALKSVSDEDPTVWAHLPEVAARSKGSARGNHCVAPYSSGLFGFENYGWDQLRANDGSGGTKSPQMASTSTPTRTSGARRVFHQDGSHDGSPGGADRPYNQSLRLTEGF
ncbi:hypothetical protein DL768_006405 [Monosporascus sp. mg162]|nr:hypothetical protein DL768_006405 [Monosporascus sp. mg162]